MDKEQANKLFAEMLDLMEFELIKDKDGYGLIDLQEANLGDIQSERFESGMAILDRLDRYIDDYYVRPIEEGIDLLEDKEQLLTSSDTYDNIRTLLKMRENPEGVSKEYLDFIKDIDGDLATMDLILNYPESVVLEELPKDILKEIKSEESDLDKAKKFINEFCQNEYGTNADFSDISAIDIAYTTDEETDLPIQVKADLEKFRMIYEFDDNVVRDEQYKSLAEMNEKVLSVMNYDNLVSLSDNEKTNTIKMTLYHGTCAHNDFDTFIPDYRGAVWADTDFRMAEKYAGNMPESKVLTCEAEIKNPAHFTFGTTENWAIDSTVREARLCGHDSIVIDFKFQAQDNDFYKFALEKYPNEKASKILSSIIAASSDDALKDETISEFAKRMAENDNIVHSYVAVFDPNLIKIVDRTSVYEKEDVIKEIKTERDDTMENNQESKSTELTEGFYKSEDPYYNFDEKGVSVEFLMSMDDSSYEKIVNRTSLIEESGYSDYSELLTSDDYPNVYVSVYEDGTVTASVGLSGGNNYYSVPLSENEQELLMVMIADDCQLAGDKSLDDMLKEAKEEFKDEIKAAKAETAKSSDENKDKSEKKKNKNQVER